MTDYLVRTDYCWGFQFEVQQPLNVVGINSDGAVLVQVNCGTLPLINLLSFILANNVQFRNNTSLERQFLQDYVWYFFQW